MGLKIVFAGTPDFAIPSLAALVKSHDVCAVYTKPDSPSGRGLKVTFSPIKEFVLKNNPNLPILQPVNLKDADTQKQLSEFYADIMVVIAYGLILPKSVFQFFKYGCINVHASLLPRWRGAAPIQRAILAGDNETGVTIMQISEGLDTGDMLAQASYQIQKTDNARDVHDHLATLGAQALIKALEEIEAGKTRPVKQDNQFATYAAKLSKEEALIDWQEPAIQVFNKIKAFNPWPVAYTYLAGQLLKIWEAEIISTQANQYLPGQIIAASNKGIDVATQQGVIRLLTIQLSGGKPIAVGSFLNARSSLIVVGQTLLGA